MLQLARNERDATQIDSDHTSQLQSTKHKLRLHTDAEI
jgi:hypothetical protein